MLLQKQIKLGCTCIKLQMKDMSHENINPFLGACVDSPNICVMTVYCPKGSVQVRGAMLYMAFYSTTKNKMFNFKSLDLSVSLAKKCIENNVDTV